MDEARYRQSLRQLDTLHCVFEKAILSGTSACSLAQRFCLAEREGVSCRDAPGHARCTALLSLLRSNANFALGTARVGVQLPHNKEIRLQSGGLMGVQQAVAKESGATIANINSLISHVIEIYSSLEALPFDEVVKQIVHHEVKKRHRSE